MLGDRLTIRIGYGNSTSIDRVTVAGAQLAIRIGYGNIAQTARSNLLLAEDPVGYGSFMIPLEKNMVALVS